MAAGSLVVPVEEYLSTTYRPNSEYIDGLLRQKSMPTWKHALIAAALLQLINMTFRRFLAVPELTVRLREGKFLIPDVAVQRRDHIQDPYPTEPIHLCVEILSPDDRISEVFAKCEDYHEWGVLDTWIVDPESQRAWIYRKGELPREVAESGALEANEISLPLASVFSALNA
jgi:Uma2 family endonuclease